MYKTELFHNSKYIHFIILPSLVLNYLLICSDPNFSIPQSDECATWTTSKITGIHVNELTSTILLIIQASLQLVKQATECNDFESPLNSCLSKLTRKPQETSDESFYIAIHSQCLTTVETATSDYRSCWNALIAA